MNRVSDLVHRLMGMFLAASAVSIIGTGCRASQPSPRPATTVPPARNVANPVTEDSQGPFRVILAVYPERVVVGEPIIITEVLVNVSDKPVLADFCSVIRTIDPPGSDWWSGKKPEDGTVFEEGPPLQSFLSGEVMGGGWIFRFEPWDTISRVYTVIPHLAGEFDLHVRWTSDRDSDTPPNFWRGTVRAKPLRLYIFKGNQRTPMTTWAATQPATKP